MGLTGLEIYKQLPKKNCGECGPPTCLAFAMSLANGKASLESCPYVTDEAKANLEAASAPPIAKIVVGKGQSEYEMGDETELFRHDKRYYHETAMAFLVSDSLNDEELNAKVDEINGLVFERVGQTYKVQMLAVANDSGDASKFQEIVQKVAAKTELALLLISEDPKAIDGAIGTVAEKNPLIYAATEANYEEMVEVAKKYDVPLAVKADGLEALASLVDKINAAGYKKLVIDPGSRETSQAMADFVQIRRHAVKKTVRAFGYPIIAFTSKEEPLEEVNQAVAYVSKYASLVVLKTTAKAHILPLLSWRQNLYTDPQVPISVEEKLNAVGDVNENSPLLITTNFSLTYYSVEGEVEGSRIPAFVLPVDTDGLSVLTAYADGKYEADKIAGVMKKFDADEKVKSRKVIIPGTVAVLKGQLEEESGFDVIVGPREATGLIAFLKSQFGS